MIGNKIILIFILILIVISGSLFLVVIKSRKAEDPDKINRKWTVMSIDTMKFSRDLAQEKLNPTKLAGLVVGLTGVIFLLLTRTTGIAEAGTAFNPQGPLLALAGVFVAAASGVYARLRLAQADFIVVTAGQMLAGFLSVLPFAVTLSSLNLANVSWRGGFSVFYTGIIGSFLAFLLVFYMIKHFGATTATLPTYIMPAVSGILGALILGEIITFPLIIGAVIILFGVFLASR